MNLRFKLKISSIVCVCFALYAFYSLNPVFTWNTFMGGIFGSVFGLQYATGFALIGIICTLFIVSKRNSKSEFRELKKDKNIGGKRKQVIVMFLGIIAFFNVAVASNLEHFLTFVWMPYFVIAMYIFLPQKIQYNTYKLYYNIFVVTLIVPIIVFVLQTAGFQLPYVPIESYEVGKQGIGVSYNLYPLALTRVQRFQTVLYGRQLCAIYDEPGRVGTMCGLFLCAEKFRLKENKKNIILLIAGMMSFSLAFYMIIISYFFAKSIMETNKKGIIGLGAIIIVYVGFINIPFSNPDLQKFQSRFLLVSGRLLGDNRTNDKYDNIMMGIFQDGFKALLWGHGTGAASAMQASNLIDGSSYMKLIYDYGFWGFVNQIIWLFITGLSSFTKKSKVQIISIILVYIANMYQRPSMFSFQFMLVLFGGIIIATTTEGAVIGRTEK